MAEHSPPMNSIEGSGHLDERAGAAWLPAVDDSTRLQLMAALLSRFNHDLRTPINTVSGWMHLLQHSSDAARIAHVSSVISRNVTEQTLLLDEFVDDGRVLLGTLKPVPAPTTARDVLSAAFERATAVSSLHAVELKTRLPEASQPCNADGPRWQRLIYRAVAAVVRRAGEGVVVEVEAASDRNGLAVRAYSGSSHRGWSEADLLDLRLAALHAAAHGGRLELAGNRTEIALSLPIV